MSLSKVAAGVILFAVLTTGAGVRAAAEICASFEGNATPYCVPAAAGPEAAYNAAQATLSARCGSDAGCAGNPIWLEVREGNEAFRSVATLTPYLDAQRAAIDYLERTKRSPVSRFQTLKRMKNANDYSIDWFAQRERELSEARAAIEKVIRERARSDTDPVIMKLAARRALLDSLAPIIARTSVALGKVGGPLERSLSSFVAYRATEPQVAAALAQLARDVSAADLDGLAALPARVVAFPQSDTFCDGHRIEANRLSSELLAIQADFDRAILQFTDGMREHGIPTPDLSSTSVPALRGSSAYCTARDATVARALASILDGMRQRREALVLVRSDEQTRKARANAALLDAGARFLAEVNARVNALALAHTRSTLLRLDFLAERAATLASFVSSDSLCDPTTPAEDQWREAGCRALRRAVSGARNELDGLPATFALNLRILRARGTALTLVDQAEVMMTQGQTSDAYASHDAALRASDLQ